MTTLEPTEYLEACGRLLSFECAAFDFYTRALDAIGDQPERRMLLTIRTRHERNIGCLRDHMVALGGEPAPRAFETSAFSKAAESVAARFGEMALFMALESGETAGVWEYRKALADPQLPSTLKDDIRRRLIPRLQGDLAEFAKARRHDARSLLRNTDTSR